MFTDKRGNNYSVTLEPHVGDEADIAVIIRHPSYGDGKPISVTGCRGEPGAIDSMKAWVEHLQGDNWPESLIDMVTGEVMARN